MRNYWWQGSVVYQIYPRSFMDSNGDGIGDIPGITSKLDYIRDLGADVIWLSPVCCSPMEDNGYDISDYDHIDPVYGTDEDFDLLLSEAKARGIRVVMDMVVNHCSSRHRWFQEALKDPEGRFGKYFYIRKGIPARADGDAACDPGGQKLLPPNNWRSIFGGSAWEPISGTEYYYLHLFTKGQPDLNWENPELRDEICVMMNRYLEKGVAGFRMDAVTYLKKEEGLPSYPPDAEDGLVSCKYGALNKPGLVGILKELRDRTYGRNLLTVGEAEGVGGDKITEFTGLRDGVFSMIFDFSFCQLNLSGPNFFWYRPRKWSVEELKAAFLGAHAQAEGCWLGLCMENHDQPRSIDHYLPEEGRNFYGASMLAMFHLFRRGTPFIYQGEELGMRNIRLPDIAAYDDVSSKNQYARAVAEGFSPEEALSFIHDMSRDNARTPFQWDGSPNAGFTAADARPWLPVNPDFENVNAARESEDPSSLLIWYRKLISLRKGSETLIYGGLSGLFEDAEGVVSYLRSYEGETIAVLCCWQDREAAADLGRYGLSPGMLLADNYGGMEESGGVVRLRPFEALAMTVRADPMQKQ